MNSGVVDGVGTDMTDVVVVEVATTTVVEAVDEEAPSLYFLDVNVLLESVVRTTPIVVVVVADGGSKGTLSSRPGQE